MIEQPTDEQKDRMWQEILTIARAKAVPSPYEKSLKQIIEETKLPEDTARKFVDNLLKEGKLNRRRIGNAMYYSPV